MQGHVLRDCQLESAVPLFGALGDTCQIGPLIHCMIYCMITARSGCLLWKSNLREMLSDGQVVDFKLAEREGFESA